jgi:Putative beta-barrel porin-2, OmpL-like. bbp2
MRAFRRKPRFMAPVWIAVLCAAAIPGQALADDKGKSDPPAKATAPSDAPAKSMAANEAAAKPAPIKMDAPAPGLTERERWLLDRVELLEKRVAELESKGSPTAAPAAASAVEAVAAQPASPNAAALPAVANAASTTAATVAGASNGAANVTPMATTTASVTPGTVTAVSGGANVIPQDQAVAAIASPGKPGKAPKAEPFAFADFTWLNGNARTKDVPMDTKFFTPEIRADVDYVYDFNHPSDDSIGGSSEVFRSNEVHVTQLGVGGDFHYDNVRARLMTQFGLYSETTPRNDASPARGQWNLADAYRYVSEAYGGYHFNALHGINVDAGIFMSYVGLFSYYNFDNWAYQPSYVSSNTPWFFNGVRVQIFPTEHLKIEPWFVNGWQAYGRFNNRPGFGLQVLWRPNGWLSILGNQYALGEETLGTPGRVRYHTDDSIEVKYYDKPENFLDKMAFSLTGDMGCEHGGGVSCAGGSAKGPKQSFLGYMFYNRFWFDRDKYGLTFGGGKINNPGRYLVLLPPINGATASSGTPYFTQNPGDPFKAWDASGTFDYMPKQYITFRWEFDHRAANVPYWTGPGGITPPGGNTFGAPGSVVTLPSGATWFPDLKKIENRIDLAILVKF